MARELQSIQICVNSKSQRASSRMTDSHRCQAPHGQSGHVDVNVLQSVSHMQGYADIGANAVNDAPALPFARPSSTFTRGHPYYNVPQDQGLYVGAVPSPQPYNPNIARHMETPWPLQALQWDQTRAFASADSSFSTYHQTSTDGGAHMSGWSQDWPWDSFY